VPHQRTHHQSDHLVEEALTGDLDCEAFPFPSHPYGVNRPHRVLLAMPAIGRERSEIMPADKRLRLPHHGQKIQRRGHQPRPAHLKRGQNPIVPNAVTVEFSSG
jgi:hypothetical protein